MTVPSTRLFFDTEFTAFRDGKMLSLGLVTETGAEFYVELPSHAEGLVLNDFVRQEVLAQFGSVPGARAATLAEAGSRLAEFLQTLPGSLEVCCDYKLDASYFTECLRAANQASALRTKYRLCDIASEASSAAGRMALLQTFSKEGQPLRRHHALLDARALKNAWLARNDTVSRDLAYQWLFQCGEVADHAKRTLGDIHAYTDDELEDTHDFIQWLFPLPRPSPYNTFAVTPTLAEFKLLAADRLVRQGVLASWQRMLTFYGLQVLPTGAVSRGPNWRQRAPNWVVPAGHNDLRLSRILEALCLFGLRPQALSTFQALRDIVTEHRGAKAATSPVQFWQAAIGNDGAAGA